MQELYGQATLYGLEKQDKRHINAVLEIIERLNDGMNCGGIIFDPHETDDGAFVEPKYYGNEKLQLIEDFLRELSQAPDVIKMPYEFSDEIE